MSRKTYLMFVVFLVLCIVALRGNALRTSVSGFATGWGFDPESDRACLHAGARYYLKGFSEFFGLPDKSFVPDINGNSTNALDIYKHYPMGAEILTGLMHYPCGLDNPRCYRLLPFALSLGVLVYFFLFLGRIMPNAKAATLCLLLAVTPMFTNAMGLLAFHGYALALELIAITVLLRFFVMREISLRAAAMALFALAFLQGCLSLDYVFVVAFLPLPFLFLNSREPKDWRGCWLLILLSTVGFLTACAGHFFQVALYYGDITLALQDFITVGRYRASGVGNSLTWVKAENLIPLNVLRRQLDVYSSSSVNFRFPVQILIALVCLALFVRTLVISLWSLKLTWHPKGSAWALVLAFVISSLWIIVMRDHSYIHSFVNRHFFLPYFLALYLGIESLGGRVTRH